MNEQQMASCTRTDAGADATVFEERLRIHFGKTFSLLRRLGAKAAASVL